MTYLPHERTWAVVCHLSALCGLIFIPLYVVAPLIVWVFKKKSSPVIEEHGKESINFQLSMLLYGLCMVLILFILQHTIAGISSDHSKNLMLLVPAVMALFDSIMVIVAAVKAYKGDLFHYPITIHFIQ